MSDSELSDAPSTAIPPESELESSLREEVKRAARREEEYTVRSVREAVEKSLGLQAGWFKGHDTWKNRSSEIIKATVETLDKDRASAGSVTPEEKTSSFRDPIPKKSRKRASPESSTVAKKRRTTAKPELAKSGSSGDNNNRGSPAQKVTASPRYSKSKVTTEPIDSPDEIGTGRDGDDGEEASDSEMSDVIDDDGPKQSRRGTKTQGRSNSKVKKPRIKSKDDETAAVDPDLDEIKKLQGQLVKCGVRKVWGKELKPYESSKAKIKYLRGLLIDIGMTGRFSNEKAAQIKEARELAADIEAVKEGEERWGVDRDKAEQDDEGDGAKSRTGRRLIRGSKTYDFLSDGDGEETD